MTNEPTTSVRVKLTKTAVDAAEPTLLPDGRVRQRTYVDTQLTGFRLVVGAGTKTFYAAARVGGRQKVVKIGRYPPWTVDKARSEAHELLVRMDKGEDVSETKRQAAVRSITLREALALVEQRLVTGGRLRTRDDYKALVERYLAGWLDQPLAGLTRADANRRHRQLATDIKAGKFAHRSGEGKPRASRVRSGEVTADNVFRTFRLVYNRALRQHPELPANPCINVDWFRAKRPRTAIPLDRLKAWHDAIALHPHAARRDFLTLLLYSGLRFGSAAALRWQDVDLERRVVRVTTVKGGKIFDLPLSSQLAELLARRKEQAAKDAVWVFPAASESGHLVEARVEVPGIPYTPHDLRRTFITVAESLDISPYAIKALVNHTQPRGDVTAGYVALDVERLRSPMQAIGDRLAQAVRGGATVAELPKREQA